MKKQMTKDAVDQFFTTLKKSILSKGDTVKQATTLAKSADKALNAQATTIDALVKSVEALTQKVEALQAQPKANAPAIQKSVIHVAPEAHPLNGQAQVEFEDSPALIKKAMDELQKSTDKARQADLGRAVSLLTIGANPSEIKKQYNL